MIGKWRKNKPGADAISKEIIRQAELCTKDIEERWIYYTETIKFDAAIPLSTIIEGFAIPVQEFVEKQFPMLLTGPGMHFWMMIFTAVLKSGTHTKKEVNQAVSELREKFAS